MPKWVLCFFLTHIVGIVVLSVSSEGYPATGQEIRYTPFILSHEHTGGNSSIDVSHAKDTNHTQAKTPFIQAAYTTALNRMQTFLLGLQFITKKKKENPSNDAVQKTPDVGESDPLLPRKKYVLITVGPARVLQELNPESPILGMAKRGAHYPLLKAGDSWCTIVFNDQEGWIERKYLTIVDAPSSTFVMREFLTVAGIVAGIVGAIALIYIFTSRLNKIKTEWFATNKAVKKKVVIVSHDETLVQRILTNNVTPLEKCFTEIGFETKKASDSETTMKLIYHYLPDAIAVDWQLGANTQAVMEQILASKSFTNNIFVLFYNVPDPINTQPSHVIPNVHYLGISFTDRDLFNIITPIIITGEKKHTIRKSIEASALHGDISESSLVDVFQFIEIGKKTGCLLIEDNKKPIGIVYFNDGIIIYAATRSQTGKNAIFEMLDFAEGQFFFVLDRVPKTPNCSIPIVGILMEWTKEADETSGNRLRET